MVGKMRTSLGLLAALSLAATGCIITDATDDDGEGGNGGTAGDITISGPSNAVSLLLSW